MILISLIIQDECSAQIESPNFCLREPDGFWINNIKKYFKIILDVNYVLSYTHHVCNMQIVLYEQKNTNFSHEISCSLYSLLPNRVLIFSLETYCYSMFLLETYCFSITLLEQIVHGLN